MPRTGGDGSLASFLNAQISPFEVMCDLSTEVTGGTRKPTKSVSPVAASSRPVLNASGKTKEEAEVLALLERSHAEGSQTLDDGHRNSALSEWQFHGELVKNLSKQHAPLAERSFWAPSADTSHDNYVHVDSTYRQEASMYSSRIIYQQLKLQEVQAIVNDCGGRSDGSEEAAEKDTPPSRVATSVVSAICLDRTPGAIMSSTHAAAPVSAAAAVYLLGACYKHNLTPQFLQELEKEIADAPWRLGRANNFPMQPSTLQEQLGTGGGVGDNWLTNRTRALPRSGSNTSQRVNFVHLTSIPKGSASSPVKGHRRTVSTPLPPMSHHADGSHHHPVGSSNARPIHHHHSKKRPLALGKLDPMENSATAAAAAAAAAASAAFFSDPILPDAKYSAGHLAPLHIDKQTSPPRRAAEGTGSEKSCRHRGHRRAVSDLPDASQSLTSLEELQTGRVSPTTGQHKPAVSRASRGFPGAGRFEQFPARTRQLHAFSMGALNSQRWIDRCIFLREEIKRHEQAQQWDHNDQINELRVRKRVDVITLNQHFFRWANAAVSHAFRSLRKNWMRAKRRRAIDKFLFHVHGSDREDKLRMQHFFKCWQDHAQTRRRKRLHEKRRVREERIATTKAAIEHYRKKNEALRLQISNNKQQAQFLQRSLVDSGKSFEEVHQRLVEITWLLHRLADMVSLTSRTLHKICHRWVAFFRGVRTDRSCFSCIDPSGLQVCVEKWDNVTYEEEMQERKTFRGWAYGQDDSDFDFMDGVVIPSKTWHRMGIYAEHIISTDNGRHADPESKIRLTGTSRAKTKMPPNQEQQDSSTTKGSNAALHAADKHISTGGHARAHDISDSFHRLPLLGRLRILDSMAVHMLPLTLEVQAELEAEKVARSTQDAEEQVNALLKRAQAGDNAVDGNTGTSTQRRESLAVKGPELLRRQSSFDSAVPDASTNGFAGIQSSGKVGVTLHGGGTAKGTLNAQRQMPKKSHTMTPSYFNSQVSSGEHPSRGQEERSRQLRGSLAAAPPQPGHASKRAPQQVQRRASEIVAATKSGAAALSLEAQQRLESARGMLLESVMNHAAAGGHPFAEFLGICRWQQITTLLNGKFVTLDASAHPKAQRMSTLGTSETRTDEMAEPGSLQEWAVFAAFAQAMNDHTDCLMTPTWVIAYQERKFAAVREKLDLFEGGALSFDQEQLGRGGFGGLDDEGLVDKEEFAEHQKAVVENAQHMMELSGTVVFVCEELLEWYKRFIYNRLRWHPLQNFLMQASWHGLANLVLSQSLMRRHDYELPNGHGLDLGKHHSFSLDDHDNDALTTMEQRNGSDESIKDTQHLAMLNKLKMRLRRKLLDITQTKAHEVHAPSDLMPTVMAAVAKKRLDAARKTCGEAVHHAIKVHNDVEHAKMMAKETKRALVLARDSEAQHIEDYARAAYNELCGVDGVGCTMHHFRVFCESTELPAIISIINSVGDGDKEEDNPNKLIEIGLAVSNRRVDQSDTVAVFWHKCWRTVTRNLFHYYDRNKDGFLDFDEFLGFYRPNFEVVELGIFNLGAGADCDHASERLTELLRYDPAAEIHELKDHRGKLYVPEEDDYSEK